MATASRPVVVLLEPAVARAVQALRDAPWWVSSLRAQTRRALLRAVRAGLL